MAASKSDLDRVYWSLVVLGPMTLWELLQWTNWTRSRTNDALQVLKRAGAVQLLERGQHRSRGSNQMRCGKWHARTSCAVADSPVIDAEIRA